MSLDHSQFTESAVPFYEKWEEACKNLSYILYSPLCDGELKLTPSELKGKLMLRYYHELELFSKFAKISELSCELKLSSELLYNSPGNFPAS